MISKKFPVLQDRGPLLDWWIWPHDKEGTPILLDTHVDAKMTQEEKEAFVIECYEQFTDVVQVCEYQQYAWYGQQAGPINVLVQQWEREEDQERSESNDKKKTSK